MTSGCASAANQNMSSKVEVLCPSGHTVIVKTNPNTKLLQVLEEACTKKNFLPPTDYELRHSNPQKTLDLTLSIRFAGLPNHAKLEMVKSAKTRSQGMVLIAIQLECGERLQHEFSHDTTLWDILKHWETETGRQLIQGPDNQQPVCVHMREEVIGEDAIRQTSLHKLGLLGGRAVIRFLYKTIDSSMEKAEDIPSSLEGHNAPRVPSVIEKQELEIEKDSFDLSKPIRIIPVVTDMEQQSSEQLEISSTSILEEPMDIDTDITKMKLPKDNNCVGHQSHSEMEVSNTGNTTIAKQETNVPPILQNQHQPSEHKVRTIERQPVLYSADNVMTAMVVPEEPSDEFFEVTVADVRNLHSDLHKKMYNQTNQPLMTQAMKKAQMESRLEKYDPTFIRIHFPDKMVLQGAFKPREPVYSIYKFVKKYLADKSMDFQLYTSPPKQILKDQSQMLMEAQLVPLTLIYFGSQVQKDHYLTSELMTEVATQSRADQVVVTNFPVALRPVALRPASEGTTSEPRISKRRAPKNQPRSDESKEESTGKGVPKWFKTGKK